MKEKILKTLLVILLLITMTMANFILLGVNCYTYAVETINEDRITNNKNVEFMSYFKNANGDILTKNDVNMNAKDLKLYFKVIVKKEGYFNGSIEILNSNFKLIEENVNKDIAKIEGNKVFLNQIKAGEEKEIEIGIEILKENKYQLDMLSKEFDVSLEGIYRDSKQKDINIKANRKISLSLSNPYKDSSESPVILEQKIITNKVFGKAENTKRIVQMQIEAGLKDNLYPIKNLNLEINVPKINNKNPGKVEVISADGLNINGKMIDNNQIAYDEINGKVVLNIENDIQEGKVNWTKQGSDKFIVTYVFDGEKALEEQKINTKATYSLYDVNNTKYSMEIERTVMPDEIDSIIELNVNSREKEIYKGKIYAGIDREFIDNIQIQVNAQGIATKIEVEENYNNNKLNIISKGIAVKKEDLIDILGQDGKIVVKSKNTKEVIGEISKQTQENEKGNIILWMPENVGEVIYEISKPEKIGVLNIQKVNVIKSTQKSISKNVNEIEYGISGKYLINDIQNKIESKKDLCILKESETSARLEINKDELSTMIENKNVEIRAILETASEKNDLYKNPVLKIRLPEKISEVKLNSVKLLNEEELKIKNAKLNGKVIEIELQNEQTKYKNETIEGTVVIVSLDLKLDKKEKDSIEKIELFYNNEKANKYKDNANYGKENKDIKIVSFSGLITANNIPEYGIETVNDFGNKNAKLKIGDNVKKATLKAQVINNEGKEVRNVQIFGTFPTKDSVNQNNISAVVSEIRVLGIAQERVKIYYTKNQNADKQIDKPENGWTSTIESNADVKKYLIIIDKLDIGEEFNFEYNMAIPSNLEYNKVGKQGYSLYYTVQGTEVEQVKENEFLTLETGVGPVVEAQLNATVGGETATTVKEGEFIQYEITVKNMGTEKVQNVKLSGMVPEGTIYVEEETYSSTEQDINQNLGFKEYKNKKTVEFQIENLEIGEEIVKEYYVKVVNCENKIAKNVINIEYGEVKKESNKIETELKKGVISACISSDEDFGEVRSLSGYRFNLSVENISDKTLKNIKVFPKVENAKINSIFAEFKNEKDEIIGVKDFSNFDEFVIDKINSKEKLSISIRVIVDDLKDNYNKFVKLQAKLLVDDQIYNTNLKKVKAKGILVNIKNTSENDGAYVKSGDEIFYKITVTNNDDVKYFKTLITDTISINETFLSISQNGIELSEGNYRKYPEITGNGETIEIRSDLDIGETKEYVIKTVVNKIEDNRHLLKFDNIANLEINGFNKGNAIVTHFLEPQTINPEVPNNPDNSNDSENLGVGYKIISGIAWLDKNDNNQKDGTDELLSNITVKLFDIRNNKFVLNKNGNILTSKTDNNGFYDLIGIPEGEYIVVFEYDTSKYGLVEYKKAGVLEKDNSNVIEKEMKIDGNIKKVGVSEILKITNTSIANINIGLKELKKFDMKLDKFVSRIVVNNPKGVKTYELGEALLGKADINAKQVNSTNVVVEYKIKVTNEGEIPGYVKKIEDRVAKDYKFNSEMNKNWYKSGEVLENASLANIKINPGESKEINLILTKQMTENNIGLINNTAEISEVYNEQGLKDIDSIPGNNIKSEDDMGSADVILSIKTGEVVMVVVTIITLIAVLSVSAYFIVRIIMRKKDI